MARFVAFLRGINVGGHRVKMDDMREAFRACGVEDVSTFLASGNVSFSTDRADPDALRGEIEAHLDDRFGFEVPIVLRTVEEVAALAAFGPDVPGFDVDGYSHYVVLLDEAPTTGVRDALGGMESEMDRFVFTDREAHWLVPGKLSDSPLFGRGIDQAFRGLRHTMRNVNTLRRLAKREAASG